MNHRLITLRTFFACIFFASTPHCQSQSVSRSFEAPQSRFIFRVEHVNNGELPLNSISDVTRAPDSFVWMAGGQALIRYDGYDLVYYRSPLHEPDTKLSNWNMRVLVDHLGFIWTGTRGGGLKSFDTHTEKFARFLADSTNPEKLSRSIITALFEDRYGVLWVGTPRGVNSLDRERKSFARFSDDTSETANNCSHAVTSIVEDLKGTLWLGTTAGLSKFNRNINRFIRYGTTNAKLLHLPNDTVLALCRDGQGLIWIGTPKGVVVFDPNTGKPDAQTYSSWWPESIRKKPVLSVCEDGLGNMWIGTLGEGVVLLDRSAKESFQFKRKPNDPMSLKGDIVSRIYAEGMNVPDTTLPVKARQPVTVIWLSYIQGGEVSRITVRRNEFKNLPIERLGFSESRGTYLWDVALLNDGTVWAGNSNEDLLGLLKIDLEGHRFVRFVKGKDSPKSIASNNVRQILEDQRHNLWVSAGGRLQRYNSQGKNFKAIPLSAPVVTIAESRDTSLWLSLVKGTRLAGLAKLNPSTETCTTFPRPPDSSTTQTDGGWFRPFEDSKGFVWMGTLSGGLYSFDTRSRTYKRFVSSAKDTGSLKINTVVAIVEDSDGELWIGTHAGLHRFDRKTQSFQYVPHPHYPAEGLTTFFIRDMVYDGQGGIWIASDPGLSRFDVRRRTFRDFNRDKGLEIVSLGGIHFNSTRKEMIIGGANGLAIFHPDRLVGDTRIPMIALTDFRIHEKSVALPTPLLHTKTIEIPYSANFFSFIFSTVAFANPSENLYAYRMDGFDREWVHTGTRRYASYTNLEPGSYVFRVKGSNSDGLWNEAGISVEIIITPPWYRSMPAYISYAILLACAFYRLERLYRRRLTLRHEMQMKDFEARKLLEIDQIKSRFFANISHEFRTPLTLILGPIERIKAALEEPELREDLDVMRRSGQRLLQLINRLLDLSKVDAGQMPLCARRTDLVSFLRTHVSAFLSHAERKGVDLTFESSLDSIEAYIDREKLEEILSNLISNAIKFTPRGGSVVVSLSATPASALNEPVVQIGVRDTGVGIPTDNLTKIFDRFFQVSNEHTGGTGIGLALAKELVELHGGTISASSVPDEGSVFTVVLPIGKEHLRPDQIIEVTRDEAITPVRAHVPDTVTQEIAGVPDFVKDSKHVTEQPQVLLIEDNADVRRFIKSILESEYVIEEAADGESGIKAAIESVPDLVVSDIMMPGIDGVEVCKRLKTDERTSRIPLILLTAKASSESKMEGLETGADDYIVKPFDDEELKARIKNLIHTRILLREKYRQAFALQAEHPHVSAVDEQFLKKAVAAVEQHIAESGYQTMSLAFELCMSRMSLNRKLQALTGHSTHDFIRTLRLHKAVQLLNQHSHNVSEVAYEVGFSSVSHFTKAFREQFGRLPSEYAVRGPSKPAD